MKKLMLVIGLSVFLAFACSKMEPKICDYCGGQITYAPVNSWGSYSMCYSSSNGKNFHTWCEKIRKLEATK